MNAIDFSPLYRTTVGFDRFANLLDSAMQTQTNRSAGYPPYDIVSIEEGKYQITLAVAGFSESDLEIETSNGVLSVKGKRGDESNPTYLHQGIAKRSFERKFELADHVEVVAAKLVNGLLEISLVKELPDAMKPKRIAIANDGVNALEQGNTVKQEDLVAA